MITATDIFAGAGGSSTGAASVPGVVIRRAANHWPLAVQVHQQNHPETEHACVDLHLEDPRNFPKTDLLWASPECTKWSIANSFRMLEPHEIAAGMSFPLDYQWSGNKRERVRLAGNAVTPPAARDLVAAVVESLS